MAEEAHAAAMLHADGSSATMTAAGVQVVLLQEIGRLTERLMEDMEELQHQQLQALFSEESQKVAEQLVRFLAGGERRADGEQTLGEMEARHRIKAVFAKCFSRAWLFYTVVPLKVQPKEESRELLQSLLDTVDSLFLSEDRDAETAGKRRRLFPRLDAVLEGRDLDFHEDFGRLIEIYIRDGSISPPVENLRSRKQVTVFLSTVNSFVQNRAELHVERAAAALLREPESPSADGEAAGSQVSLTSAELSGSLRDAPPPSLDMERKKMVVKNLLSGVLSLILKKAMFSLDKEQSRLVKKRLFYKVWTEVKDAEFQFTAETLVDFDKSFVEHLGRKWGNARMVLQALVLAEPAIDKYIVRTFREQLTTPRLHAAHRLLELLRRAVGQEERDHLIQFK